jgi:hypothetical protein
MLPLPLASRIFKEKIGVPGAMPTTDSTAGSVLLFFAVMMPATCVPAGDERKNESKMRKWRGRGKEEGG